MSDGRCYDIVIVGAGAAGLCFAAALRGTPLRIALIDKLDEAILANPAYDGREIALTLRSVATLRTLGLWERLPSEQVAPLHGARVYNGESLSCLDLRPPPAAPAQIGYLVSNHLLRRAAHEAARANAQISWFARTHVTQVSCSTQAARVALEDGRALEARLIVAADSRFSETRRALGIAARMHDFGRTMLTCRMTHEVEHQRIAQERFGHHQTLALLPLNGQCSSVILTLPHAEITRLQQLSADAFERELERRCARRLGRMSLNSERFAYPLVGVYATRFVAERFAAIGDAAVGMHPVTAHGFNFCLASHATLAQLLRQALHSGQDIADASLLRRYEQAHRRATLPLYLATNAIARLYTDESPPARLARAALLHLAHRIPPVGSTLSRLLIRQGAPAAGDLRLVSRA